MRTLLILARASNLPTVWTNVVAAWFLNAGTWDQRLLWTCIAGSLIYVGGMTLNDAFDARWDKEHGKERPIPKGEIDAGTVWLVGSVWLITGSALILLMGAIPWTVAVLVGCILLYNAVHKKWTGSIWIMGACRLFLYVSATTVVAKEIPSSVWLWGGALMVYIAGITLAARGEDTGGTVRGMALLLLMIPALLLLGLVVRSPHDLNVPLSAGLVLLFVSWVVLAWRQLPNIGGLVGYLLAGIVLVDALAISSVDYLAAAVCAAFLPLNRLFQKYIPAT